jgi:hypothetical protein
MEIEWIVEADEVEVRAGTPLAVPKLAVACFLQAVKAVHVEW